MWHKIKENDSVYFYNSDTKEKSQERPKEGFRLYHILIKHINSRNPVERSELESLNLCKKIYEELQTNINIENFREYFKSKARELSECKSSLKGGDLGFVCKNEMYKEFEKAAFILKRGRIIGPVKTPSGYHIIFRR
ncbi:peptidyl-prolyl cis-trans isomerase NIMA-interacting 1 (PIN1) [Vairimorpha necatrix]|uniref:Peptidyl-prolyl cis-trans isomerase n=1 Tax=Vairimorpha necatrix TaxID=6039 RepID=A0AAX4JCG1_9MICR